MNITDKTIYLVKLFEGCKLNAYLCPAGIATIGCGSTFYTDGSKVKIGDQITQDQADKLLLDTLNKFGTNISKVITATLTDNQFSALVSFTYNIGVGALKSSTLLKKVNINPNDLSIAKEFTKWDKANGKVIPGLLSRRIAESKLYFS